LDTTISQIALNPLTAVGRNEEPAQFTQLPIFPFKCTASLLSLVRAFHSELSFTHCYRELNGNPSGFSYDRINILKVNFPYCTTGPTAFAQVKIRATFGVFVQ
jgi:hypothetical protein